MVTLKVALGHYDSHTVTLVASGKMNGGSLAELRREIENARQTSKQVVLDISEVTLIDRTSLAFLAEQTSNRVQIVNCPEYIEPWIKRVAAEEQVVIH